MTRLTAVQIGSGWFPEIAGGLNRYYHDLIRFLPEAGVNVRGLVVGSANVDVESGGRVHAYAPAQLSLPKRWAAVRAASKKIWDEIPYGVPAVQVTHFAPYAWPLPRPPEDRPWIVHFHGPWAAESAREGGGRLSVFLKSKIERSVYRRAVRFIVLSSAFKTLLCDTYDVDESRVVVIPGGVDIARFTPAYETPKHDARVRMGWPTDRPIILSVRRLASRMGLETLIDAMAEVRRRVPDALCLIAGRGRLHAALQARITAAGLQDHVRLLGYVDDDDLPWAYRAADVSILPSESLEGFGLSAVESLASGTPVLVVPIGGLSEVVRDLDPSLILPPTPTSDPEALAAMLATSCFNPANLPPADACQTYAARSFAWPTLADRIATVYREANEPPVKPRVADRNRSSLTSAASDRH